MHRATLPATTSRLASTSPGSGKASRLCPVGGAAVRTALEPLAQPSGTHDDRKREQRFADALVELASAGKPANLQVTATIETLKGLAGAAAGEMEFSLPISSTSVQRM